MKVQFERNVVNFFPRKKAFAKKEVDIVVHHDKDLIFAVELKYPRNGQYPEQMFSFCKDIAFAEELKGAGFRSAAFLVFADDKNFYEGNDEKIYGFFRAGRTLHGCISKPTGPQAGQVSVNIAGHYSVNWITVAGGLKYALVQVQ